MDAQTGADFKNCGGGDEAKLAREYVRNEVNIRVKYIKIEENESESMMIELREARTYSFQLSWWISAESVGTTKVVFTSAKPETLILDNKSFQATFCMIIRRILTEPMFILKNMEFQLGNYTEAINLGSINATIECLIFNGCFHKLPIISILEHNKLEYKAAVGVTYHDFECIYCFKCCMNGVVLHFGNNTSCNTMSEFCYALRQNPPMIFPDAQRRTIELFLLTVGGRRSRNMDNVANKIELPKTTNDIMYFRAAYYYQPNSVPYLRTIDDRFEEEIAFLKDGIDGYLSDYQLTVLSLYYFLRLFRNEPAMRNLEEETLKEFRNISIEQGSIDCYNKFVSKIEALLPLP